MVKVRKAGVETPCLYLIDSANTKIYMERVEGVTAKRFFIDSLNSESASSSLNFTVFSVFLLDNCSAVEPVAHL